MWVSTNFFYFYTRYPVEEATWYAPAPLYANPILLGYIFAFIQCTSHYPEDLPPRMNGTDHWMTLKHYFSQHSFAFIVGMLAVSINCGTVNEFLAGPRLFPLFVLRQFFKMGYQEGKWKRIKEIVALARKSGKEPYLAVAWISFFLIIFFPSSFRQSRDWLHRSRRYIASSSFGSPSKSCRGRKGACRPQMEKGEERSCRWGRRRASRLFGLPRAHHGNPHCTGEEQEGVTLEGQPETPLPQDLFDVKDMGWDCGRGRGAL